MQVDELLHRWREVRRGLNAALDQVTDAQLAFVPCQGLWSLGVTVLHIASAEEGWFRYVVQRILDEWPPDEDYALERFPTVADVKAVLAAVHTRTEAFLLAEGDSSMSHPVALPWGGQMTLADVAWHVFEHEIHHRGEVCLMLGLMGMEAPDV